MNNKASAHMMENRRTCRYAQISRLTKAQGCVIARLVIKMTVGITGVMGRPAVFVVTDIKGKQEKMVCACVSVCGDSSQTVSTMVAIRGGHH